MTAYLGNHLFNGEDAAAHLRQKFILPVRAKLRAHICWDRVEAAAEQTIETALAGIEAGEAEDCNIARYVLRICCSVVASEIAAGHQLPPRKSASANG